jgi:hypothetical protein
MASALLYRQDIGEPTLHASDNGTIKGHRVNVPLPKEDDILKLKFKNDDDAMEWLTALVRYVERAGRHVVYSCSSRRPRVAEMILWLTWTSVSALRCVSCSWKQWVDQQQEQDQTSGGQNRAAPPSIIPTEVRHLHALRDVKVNARL